MLELSPDQLERFDEDGFLILDKLVEQGEIDRIVSRYEPLFRGEFETGTAPDEVNWREGRDSNDLTRQICNGWKADRTLAGVVLSENIGRAIGYLSGWSGVRVMSDNVLWKPPGARPLGYHQDCAYLRWYDPSSLLSFWIALDATTADGGTIEFVRGSHKWARPEPAGEFHGPEDYRKYMEHAAGAEGVEPEIVRVEVPRGGGSFHHGWVWHGSGFNNSSSQRRTLVIHAMPEIAEYVPDRLGDGTGNIYSRYKKFGSTEMDENFFPIVWSGNGRRTPGIDEYIAGKQ